ncbi:TauD/TfdA dioxygenase family protein [Altericroceibacterium endophyticum]|uniref:TauD/TfdA family dioxygenase n=1 Tax=Altericroceibacterium endophyticum TaxID=1808508 RepID=A0A6I4T6R7_9SPHN|nr:TauD/TfdA family dioxygenase [Altericroceibacterium endophyticum]MXO66149.1 TauD/TfdA family dioxygenase [Altericroceibacterium endophyticum]
MSLKIQPILPRFGAECSGLDLTKPLDDKARRDVLEAMSTWGVCVYRNTGLDDEGHIAFSRNFGHLELAPARKGGKSRLNHRELFDASNINAEGQINTDPAAKTYRKGDRLWHTDSAFMDKRSSLSLLLAHEVPEEGGETWFADTRSAYDDLPQDMKDRLEGLVGRNSLWWSRKMGGADIPLETVNEGPIALHPIVHTHAGSGRKALFIAAHTVDIEGIDHEEGCALVRELIEFATQPQYVFSVKYAPGDMVIWDNLCSMHRGGDFDYDNERRDMRRTTVREGTEPYARLDDDPFTDLFKSIPKTVDLTGTSSDNEKTRQNA